MRYNLRAADAATLTAALTAAGLIDVDGNAMPGVALDIIGPIHKPTGETDDAGNPVLAPIAGYHANLIADLTPEQEALLPLVPAPARPYRIFAGE